jgi:hypothetical protein
MAVSSDDEHEEFINEDSVDSQQDIVKGKRSRKQKVSASKRVKASDDETGPESSDLETKLTRLQQIPVDPVTISLTHLLRLIIKIMLALSFPWNLSISCVIGIGSRILSQKSILSLAKTEVCDGLWNLFRW